MPGLCEFPCMDWLKLPQQLNDVQQIKPVVDLEEVIKKSAWEMVELPTVTCFKRRQCSKKQIELCVDWNYMDLEDEVVSLHLREDSQNPIRFLKLFETTFENKSGKTQQFAFKADRQTVSSFEFSVQQGFSIGGTFNLSFSLQKSEDTSLPNVSSSLGGHVTWTGSVGQKMTKTETMSWGVDSQITLDDGQSAVATLKVQEANVMADIKILSTLTVTSSSQLIPVDVRSKKDGSLLEIVDIPCSELCRLHPEIKPVEGHPDKVTIETLATCRAVYGVEQNVKVRPLQNNQIE